MRPAPGWIQKGLKRWKEAEKAEDADVMMRKEILWAGWKDPLIPEEPPKCVVGKLGLERPDAAAWIIWYTWARLLTSKSFLDVWKLASYHRLLTLPRDVRICSLDQHRQEAVQGLNLEQGRETPSYDWILEDVSTNNSRGTRLFREI